MGHSASFNQVILVGRVGREPEYVRDKEGYNHSTRISLVTNEVHIHRDTKEKKEYSQWHTVYFKGKLADVARDYLHKGLLIFVRATLKYWRRDDIKYTIVDAHDLVILTRKPDPF